MRTSSSRYRLVLRIHGPAVLRMPSDPRRRLRRRPAVERREDGCAVVVDLRPGRDPVGEGPYVDEADLELLTALTGPPAQASQDHDPVARLEEVVGVRHGPSTWSRKIRANERT